MLPSSSLVNEDPADSIMHGNSGLLLGFCGTRRLLNYSAGHTTLSSVSSKRHIMPFRRP